MAYELEIVLREHRQIKETHSIYLEDFQVADAAFHGLHKGMKEIERLIREEKIG